MTEREFQSQVTDLAELLGYTWVHFRPAQTKHGWRTPVEGPMGAGWPDLVLLRVRDRRLMFVELKADKGTVTAAQAGVLAALTELEEVGPNSRGIEVHVWRPAQFDEIVAALS